MQACRLIRVRFRFRVLFTSQPPFILLLRLGRSLGLFLISTPNPKQSVPRPSCEKREDFLPFQV